jgi:hypothetical protein
LPRPRHAARPGDGDSTARSDAPARRSQGSCTGDRVLAPLSRRRRGRYRRPVHAWQSSSPGHVPGVAHVCGALCLGDWRCALRGRGVYGRQASGAGCWEGSSSS